MWDFGALAGINDGFNPLPAPEYREMEKAGVTRRCSEDLFQSAPCTRVQGDPCTWLFVAKILFRVSIRSLHQSTGRCAPELAGTYKEEFQSAPCTRVQGDLGIFRGQRRLYRCFNPLPAPEYREMWQQLVSTGQITGFQSAPCTRVQGDTYLSSSTRKKFMFQSAPCTRVQGDLTDDQPHDVQRAIGLFQSAPCTRVQGDT